jgi:hypothetical protein
MTAEERRGASGLYSASCESLVAFKYLARRNALRITSAGLGDSLSEGEHPLEQALAYLGKLTRQSVTSMHSGSALSRLPC